MAGTGCTQNGICTCLKNQASYFPEGARLPVGGTQHRSAWFVTYHKVRSNPDSSKFDMIWYILHAPHR